MQSLAMKVGRGSRTESSSRECREENRDRGEEEKEKGERRERQRRMKRRGARRREARGREPGGAVRWDGESSCANLGFALLRSMKLASGSWGRSGVP